jgi:hypothetical protein
MLNKSKNDKAVSFFGILGGVSWNGEGKEEVPKVGGALGALTEDGYSGCWFLLFPIFDL